MQFGTNTEITYRLLAWCYHRNCPYKSSLIHSPGPVTELHSQTVNVTAEKVPIGNNLGYSYYKSQRFLCSSHLNLYPTNVENWASS
jgi:hypothetical protein